MSAIIPKANKANLYLNLLDQSELKYYSPIISVLADLLFCFYSPPFFIRGKYSMPRTLYENCTRLLLKVWLEQIVGDLPFTLRKEYSLN